MRSIDQATTRSIGHGRGGGWWVTLKEGRRQNKPLFLPLTRCSVPSSGVRDEFVYVTTGDGAAPSFINGSSARQR